MSDASPLVIIGAGGTGGHMFPAAAFAEEMRRRGWQIGLMSDDRGLRYGANFPADWKQEVRAASPNVRKPWTLPGTVLRLNAGVRAARKLMQQQRPALIAGFGGYPAYPALSAGRQEGVPLLIHEQNAVLGRVNRRFAANAGAVASGFARLERLPDGARAHHVPLGNPVRAPILAVRDVAYPSPQASLNLLITGGSQGSRIFGEALPEAICHHVAPELRSRLQVVQQVRPEQVDAVKAAYSAAGIEAEVDTFFNDMAARLSAAHFLIARSGAGTVSEIAVVGRPAILIPLKIAMDDHQTANAAALADVGAADIVSEDNLTAQRIGELLTLRLSDQADLMARAAAAHGAGRVDATRDLADLAERIADKHEGDRLDHL